MTVDPGAGWHPADSPPAIAAPIPAVDRWRLVVDGEARILTARAGVRGDDPNLRGHFPGLPILPGVFVIETLCQAMALAFPGRPGRPTALRAVRSVRFLAPLLDGDELTLDATVTPLAGGGWSVRAVGTRRDDTVSARIWAEFDAGEAGDA